MCSYLNYDRARWLCKRSIAERLGYSRVTINKTLKLLAIHGLVKIVKKHGRACEYLLLRCKANETQVSSGVNRDVNQAHTNNIQLTRNFINKSRAALLNHFTQKYEKTNNNFRD